MPSRLEDYQELHTVGSGSYGKCKKVLRKADGKILVWKELDYSSMSESEKQMLVSEVNVLRELKHPNIVRYYDRIVDRTKAKLYIVMEYCEGGDLASLIKKCACERRFLDEEFVLRVFAQLILALKDCHKRNDGGLTVLHRDLKPANIFLDAKQNVKLGDFGLARILQHDHSFAKTFVGTPYYMSPEQMNYEAYNEKSDIWSLGCLLYELCSLTPPFTAYNQKILAERIKEGKFARIPFRYSDELYKVIVKMLSLKDYLRPSVDELLQNPLLTHWVTEEKVKNEKKPCRCMVPDPCTHSDPAALDIQLKEQQLLSWEKELKEREAQLEKRERVLCVRERLFDEQLTRAQEVLNRNSKLKVSSNDQDDSMSSSSSSRKKKVHFVEESKENKNSEKYPLSKEKSAELKKRLREANVRAKALCEMEKNYQLKSKQILGMR
ncbi:serine/threonine-protein kinase Nek2 [Ambystoma mexicanum]|uniref:serine/threonine-protein kinase Nek2 n=1 Tax=Ambystoma mexicanum TaxID=8296 RepID=UPI0037E95AF1